MTLERIMRLDSIPMSDAYFTEQGYFRDEPIVTSVGIFEYRKPDGTLRRELRVPEEVFKPESLASYQGKPIVISHNRAIVDGGIDKDNVSDEIVGTILDPGYRDGNDVRCKIVIHDIDKVKATNARELSLGYTLDLDETPGEWNGEHYDAVQRNIMINHLAIVTTARAGDQAHLNLDGDEESENILQGGKVDMGNTEDSTMMSPDDLVQAILDYKKSGTRNDAAPGAPAPAFPFQKKAAAAPVTPAAPAGEAEVPAEATNEKPVQADSDAEEDKAQLIALLEQLIKKLKGAPAEPAAPMKPAEEEDACGGMNTDSEGKEGSGDMAKDKAMDEGEEEGPDTGDAGGDANADGCGECKKSNNDAADEIVQKRLAICRIGDRLNLDGLENMSIREGKLAIIKKVMPEMRLDGKDDAHIDAYFDIACEDAKNHKGTDYQRRQMASGQNRRNDSAEGGGSMAEASRQRMIDRQEGIEPDNNEGGKE